VQGDPELGPVGREKQRRVEAIPCPEVPEVVLGGVVPVLVWGDRQGLLERADVRSDALRRVGLPTDGLMPARLRDSVERPWIPFGKSVGDLWVECLQRVASAF